MQRSVLHIATDNAVGLVEKASRFVTENHGDIVANTVRVFGDKAFLLLYFRSETKDVEQMIVRLPGSELQGMRLAEIVETRAPDDAGPRYVTLDVFSRDTKGLIAELSGLIETAHYDIVAHDGKTIPSGDDKTMEYKQSITLDLHASDTGAHPADVNRKWDKFKRDLQGLLVPYDGRYDVR